MKKIRKCLLNFLLIMSVTTAAVGCGSKNTEDTTNTNGPYSVDQIQSGLYIMTKDGKFYTPDTSGQNFTNEVTASDPRRIIYSYEDSKVIPTMYADDKLVYFTTGSIPDNFGVEKFRDAGYTFGLYGISKSSGGEYVFTESSFIPDSTLEASFNGYISNGDIGVLQSVDGKPLDVDNFSVAGTYKCDKKDQKVKIAFMKGTFYSEVEAFADEHVWYSAETSNVLSYETTKNGFIVLNLPNGLKDGDFISVMNTGLIQVSEKTRS